MGANFAPSYANIVMGYWEERYIWTHNLYARYLVLLGRYINDILIIWNGSIELFESFLTNCNDNTLDLICTKNDCKPTGATRIYIILVATIPLG